MKRIKERRRELGLTQKQLGEMAGVTESAISQYEKGKKHPSGKSLIALAMALDTSVEYLLEKSESPTLNRQSEARDELFEILKDATPEEKKFLLSCYEMLKAYRAKK